MNKSKNVSYARHNLKKNNLKKVSIVHTLHHWETRNCSQVTIPKVTFIKAY